MKILLIDVPFGIREIGGKRAAFASVRNVIPALGLAYLAAVAEKEGHDVCIFDYAKKFDDNWDAIVRKSISFKPDIIGITATTPAFKNALKTATLLRKTMPNAVFLAGGAHPTAAPEHAAAARVFDYLILGEGEVTFVELLQHFEGKGTTKPEDIPGLAFWRDKKLIFTQPRKPIENLDSIPLPARHLLPPLKLYHPTPASYRKLPLAHIITSRGCPSKCNFCDRSVFGEKYRKRSSDNVLAEVEEVVSKYGAREIRFFDDCFTINKNRLEEICQGLKKIRPRCIWTCLTKVNLVNPEMLQMMHDAGCWQVLYGLESGDDRVLKTLGKGTTVKQNRLAVKWTREAHIRVRADFIVGTPNETMETLTNTLNFAKKLPIDFAHFNKFVPFPGTEFYRQLIKQGYWFDFSRDSSIMDHDALVFVPSAIPSAKYREFLDRAYKEFYLRPSYILRRLFAMRTFTEFCGNIKGFFSIRSI